MRLEKPLYMVADIMWDFYKKKLGMEKNSFYYNGGVILYNIPMWREERCHERYWQFLKNSPKQYVLGDQDITNMLFSKGNVSESEIGSLQLKYNYFLKRELLHDAIKESKCRFYIKEEWHDLDKEGVIYHFSKYNGERPWEIGNTHPFKEKFDYYKSASPWRNMKLFERRISKQIAIQIKLKRILPRVIYIPILRMAQRLYFITSEKKINS